MTLSIEQARQIKADTNLLLPQSNYQMELYFKAIGIIEGWDAAVKKCAEIADDHECRSFHALCDCRGYIRCDVEALSTTSEERKSKEEKDNG